MRSHFTAPVAMLFLPMQAYNLDGATKRVTSRPGPLRTSDGVTACIALASASGVGGFSFTAKLGGCDDLCCN